MNNIIRESISKDKYQESHLIPPNAGWPRIMYFILAVFTGFLAFVIYIKSDEIISQPLLGEVGYWFFQLLTGGVFILSLYSFLWGGSSQNNHGKEVNFSWSGFLIRDLFMGAVFAPFIILIFRIAVSDKVKKSGLFEDLGGVESFLDPSSPLNKRIILGVILVVLGIIALALALIPLWLIYRAIINLGVIIKRGNSKAIFNKEKFSPGESLFLKILVNRPGKRSDKRRIFLNFIQAKRGEYPASSTKYKRNYLYSQYYDFTVEQLRQGIEVPIPDSINGTSVYSDHQGGEIIRYWEVLMEEPKKMHWARFFILVE